MLFGFTPSGETAPSRPVVSALVRTFGVISCAALLTAVVALPASAEESSGGIVISEVFSANTKDVSDADALRYDWVELQNTGTTSVDVAGWRVYDEDEDADKNYVIGTSQLAVDSTVIEPGAYLVLYLADEPGLGKGDSVTLTDGAGADGSFDASKQVGETVTLPAKTHGDPSWARKADGTYAMSAEATPGAANVFADDASETPTEPESTDEIIKDAAAGVVLDGIDLEADSVTLVNRGTSAVDLSDWTIRDSDDSHVQSIPDGTTLAAGASVTFSLDFGLGKSDAVRVYNASGALVLRYAWTFDDAVWDAHKSTLTFKANSDADGMLTLGAEDATEGDGSDDGESDGGSDEDAAAMTVSDWSGPDAVTTVDEQGEFGATQGSGEHTDGNLSGLVYEAATSTSPAVLWAADNDLNPTLGETADKGAGALVRFVQDEAGNWVQDPESGWSWTTDDGVTKGGKQLRYADGTGGVDAEGVTLINGSSSQGVFIASERDNLDKKVSRPSILRYDVTAESTDTNGDGAEDLSAVGEWNLKSLIEGTGVTMGSDNANLGLEGVAFVPDSYLVSSGLRDTSGALYDPDAYGDHFGGLFLAALEANGHIYAVALSEDGSTATLVQDIAIPESAVEAGFTVIQDLYYDADTQQVWAQCDNSCGAAEPDGTAKLATYAVDESGQFTVTSLTRTPSGVASLNTEGFAITPLSEALSELPAVQSRSLLSVASDGASDGATTTKYRQVFWSDDSVTDGYSLRTGYMAVTVTDDETTDDSAGGDQSSIDGATDGTAITEEAKTGDGTSPKATSLADTSAGSTEIPWGLALALLVAGASGTLLRRFGHARQAR